MIDRFCAVGRWCVTECAFYRRESAAFHRNDLHFFRFLFPSDTFASVVCRNFHFDVTLGLPVFVFPIRVPMGTSRVAA